MFSTQGPWSTWSAPRSPSGASRQYSTRPSEPCSVLPRWRRGVRGAPCSERGNTAANTTLHHHEQQQQQQQPLLLQEDERKKKTSASECVLLRLLTFYKCFFQSNIGRKYQYFISLFFCCYHYWKDSRGLWKTSTVHLLRTSRTTTGRHEG